MAAILIVLYWLVSHFNLSGPELEDLAIKRATKLFRGYKKEKTLIEESSTHQNILNIILIVIILIGHLIENWSDIKILLKLGP